MAGRNYTWDSEHGGYVSRGREVGRRTTVPGAVEVPGAEILTAPRAGDADRARYIAHLTKCHALGYITPGQFHARMDAAAEAPTRDELAALLADLPPLVPPRNPGRWHAALKRLRRPTHAMRLFYHVAAIAGAALWGICGAVALYYSTGTRTMYGHGVNAWVSVTHSGLEVVGIWFFAVTGIVGFIAALGTLLSWLAWLA